MSATVRVLGSDVSRYNGHMDWQKNYNAGGKYAIIRAGVWDYSTCAPGRDYEFDYNSEVAPHYMPVGYYWPIHTNVDVIRQADYFCTLVRDKPRPVKLWTDVEIDYAEQTPAVYTTELKKFLARIFANLNEVSGIYTRANFWNLNVQASADWAKLDLWIARYACVVNPWGNPGDSSLIKPRDWNTWRFWQFSADRPPNGRGAEFGSQSNSIDLNYFNGDQVAFDEYIGQVEPSLEKKVDIMWEAHPELHPN